MEKRNINKAVRDIERPFDMEGVWENINQEQSKNQGGFWLFLGIPLLFLLIFGLGSSIYSSQYKGNVQDNKLTSHATLAENSGLENNNLGASSKNLDEDHQVASHKNKHSVKETLLPSTANEIEFKVAKETSINIHQTKSTSIEKKATTSEKSISPSIPSTRILNRSDEINILQGIESNYSKNEKHTSNKNKTQEIANAKLVRESIEVPTLLNTPIQLVTNSPSKLLMAPNLTPLISTLKKPSSWSLEIIGGYGAPIRTLSNKGNARESIISNRESSEQVLEHIQASLGLRKYWTSRFSTGLGLGMSQLSESFIYEESNIQNIADIGSEDLPEGIEGKSGYIIKNKKATYYNTFRSVDMNIDVAYLIPLRRVNLQAYCGASYKLKLSKDIHFFDSFLTVQNANEQFENRMPIQWFIGTDLVIPVSSLTFFTGFQYRKISDISNESNPIEQRYSIFGGRVGVGLMF